MQNKSGGLLSAIGDSFFAFQSKLQFFEREYLKKKGIDEVTPAEIKVLYMIGMSNTKSMSEIADELKITRGTLSITVDNLVKKGYVIRARNKQDRRVVILYLTKKSVSIVKDYEEFYNALIRSLVASIDEDKAIVLDEILRNLNKIIETNFYEKKEK
ncbi:MAG: MarR family transcriptional regulator [Bacilli bacterium]|jgi:DNA-binding MarR family transcriptional regulator|nr:MarR family transcriptional regulator [Bacillota bacterium]NLM31876.1 MarR family transcriptional regulator [Acholeplasmataceae bacterium]HOA78802.1 MarR family transcriptional regulator [Bacilli bacterium]HPZ26955.1 MarR family transcriptional regulator [Bacilli bacterium]HQC89330.1 MarR family transcriptional regulator [Bacilli bacterium]